MQGNLLNETRSHLSGGLVFGRCWPFGGGGGAQGQGRRVAAATRQALTISALYIFYSMPDSGIVPKDDSDI